MRLLLALLIVVAQRGAARAQAPDPRAVNTGYIGKDAQVLEIDDCPAVPPVTPDKLREIGAEHFDRGDVLYLQGDYRGAVKELVASYCLIPYYSILKSIGQAYERELDYEKAIGYFERYVMAVPKDAVRAAACDPDPQVDKENVVARIEVLRRLKAKIVVDTSPPEADVVLANENGVQNRAKGGELMEVPGGSYTMTISLNGYESKTLQIHADVGKPYTIIEQLRPVLVTVRVRVVPADARIFLDERAVGTGFYTGALPAKKYPLSVEAPGYVTESREIEILPGREQELSIELEPQPQTGRRQLLAYAAIGGAIAGGTIAGAQKSDNLVGAGIGVGLVTGFFGTFYGTRRDLPLGTSSLTITSSLVGGTIGGGVGLVLDRGAEVGLPLLGAGLLAGAAAGYYAGERFEIRPGDAAVINSGALWGTAAGALFAQSFDADARVGGSLILSGVGMGTTAGILLTRYFKVSRGRAALIDVGGVVGIFGGLAAENVFNQARNLEANASERSANFTLGGMAAGLIIAGVLTRNMDDPKLPIAPTIGKAQTQSGSTTTFGIGGSW
jgi:hypothetical protein